MRNIFLKYKNHRLKNNKGFTSVELLVVFFIMASILAVVIPGYLEYSTKIELQNLALDVALTIREAQVYGAGAKVTSTASGSKFNIGYGVHFVKGGTSFILFENTSDSNNNRDVYTDSSPSSPPPYPPDNIIQTYTIKNGYSIYDICHSSGPWVCGDGSLDIVFKRPNPDASIKYGATSFVDGSGGGTNGRIILISPDQATTTVQIEETGAIRL